VDIQNWKKLEEVPNLYFKEGMKEVMKGVDNQKRLGENQNPSVKGRKKATRYEEETREREEERSIPTSFSVPREKFSEFVNGNENSNSQLFSLSF
jgi:hypothetical protein